MPAIWASRRLAQADSSRHFYALLRWIQCCTSVHISVPLDSSVLHLCLIRSHPFSFVLIRSHLFLDMHVHPIHLFTSVLIARGVLEHRGTPLPTCPPPLGPGRRTDPDFRGRCTAPQPPSSCQRLGALVAGDPSRLPPRLLGAESAAKSLPKTRLQQRHNQPHIACVNGRRR